MICRWIDRDSGLFVEVLNVGQNHMKFSMHQMNELRRRLFDPTEPEDIIREMREEEYRRKKHTMEESQELSKIRQKLMRDLRPGPGVSAMIQGFR